MIDNQGTGDGENPEDTQRAAIIPADIIESVARSTSTAPEVVEHVIEVVEASLHRGPLPSPETFARYNEICPGAAREILDMATRAQAHAHKIEERSLESEVEYRKLGIVLAGLIVLSMVFGAVICGLFDRTGAAVALGSAAGLVSVAGVFIRGRNLFGLGSKNAPPAMSEQSEDPAQA